METFFWEGNLLLHQSWVDGAGNLCVCAKVTGRNATHPGLSR
jgi:hypothetical protein